MELDHVDAGGVACEQPEGVDQVCGPQPSRAVQGHRGKVHVHWTGGGGGGGESFECAKKLRNALL